MDDQNMFNHHAEYEHEDAAIDAPLAVGGDERRMHVRAYNYWVSLLNGHDFPSIEDLNPDELNDFGPHSVLLDFTAGTENPAIAFLGSKLRTECDLDDHIQSIDDVPSRTLLSRLTDHYMQIIANRAPVGFEAEFTNHRGLDTMYRGILMPFSSDHDTIDFIYGVINWKEVVTGQMAETLASEVDRVMAKAPIQPMPHIDAFADGPGRQSGAQMTLKMPTAIEQDVAPSPEHECEELADWLASAREAADVAHTIESRGRGALYRAIGLAYDFALVADARPDDYQALLEDSGVVAQTRAPMTPIVKLVFGSGYDKTRLTEYATALSYAKEQDLHVGELAAHLEATPGGLKGLLKAVRAAKRPARPERVHIPNMRERARAMLPQAILNMPGNDEFVLLIARRVDGEHVGVIGSAEGDDALIERALQKLAI